MPMIAENIAPHLAAISDRSDIVTLLRPKGIGVELGVAEGGFSRQILEKSTLDHLYSIDMWAGDSGHDTAQYKIAVRKLESHRARNSILRMRFDEALDLFAEDYFDFIYVDGYAHTGEEQGKTYSDWYPKLKSGGIFAGHDYDPRWPLVVQAVDAFVAEHSLQMHIVNGHETGGWGAKYASWFAVKP